MNKFLPTVLAAPAFIAALGALNFASTDAEARGKSSSSGARSQSSGARAHATVSGSRAHTSGSGVRASGAGARAHAHVSGTHSHSYYRGVGVGVIIGAPIIAAAWWPYSGPYYDSGAYYPPIVQAPELPVVYIEQQTPVDFAQNAPQPQIQQHQFWYYCEDSQTYYPYAQDCATAWLRVVPYAPQ